MKELSTLSKEKVNLYMWHIPQLKVESEERWTSFAGKNKGCAKCDHYKSSSSLKW